MLRREAKIHAVRLAAKRKQVHSCALYAFCLTIFQLEAQVLRSQLKQQQEELKKQAQDEASMRAARAHILSDYFSERVRSLSNMFGTSAEVGS